MHAVDVAIPIKLQKCHGCEGRLPRRGSIRLRSIEAQCRQIHLLNKGIYSPQRIVAVNVVFQSWRRSGGFQTNFWMRAGFIVDITGRNVIKQGLTIGLLHLRHRPSTHRGRIGESGRILN